VLIRGGWYFLDEPLVLEPRDSGTPDAPVVYRAAPGEQPIFSGGVRLSGFRETTIHGQPGWVAGVPAGLEFTQLFVNGQRMRRTRLPRTGYYRIAESVAEPSKLELDWESRVRQFRCRPGEFDAGWPSASPASAASMAVLVANSQVPENRAKRAIRCLRLNSLKASTTAARFDFAFINRMASRNSFSGISIVVFIQL
jgi:hypothetical protein